MPVLSCWGRRLFLAGKGKAFARLCVEDARLQDMAKAVAFQHVHAWRHTLGVININVILRALVLFSTPRPLPLAATVTEATNIIAAEK